MSQKGSAEKNPLLEFHLKQVATDPLIWISVALLASGWLCAFYAPPTISKSLFLMVAEIFALWFLFPFLVEEVMEQQPDVPERLGAQQFVVGKLLPLLIGLVLISLLAALLLLSFLPSQGFKDELGWWVKSQGIVLGWAMLVNSATAWAIVRRSQPRRFAWIVVTVQVGFFLLSEMTFTFWLNMKGWLNRCIVEDPLNFFVNRELFPPWMQSVWMFFVLPFGPVFYNPLIALEELGRIHGAPPVNTSPPLWWGTWQCFMYAALSVLLLIDLSLTVKRTLGNQDEH